MKYGPLIFLGVFFTLAASWTGLVLAPQLQYGGLGEIQIEETGRPYPLARTGLAEMGRAVYQANGCIYCHSQQVRPAGFGADLARGWGRRRSVSRDYVWDQPVMLGTMRTGPDLTDIGERQSSTDWHLSHLYDPQITSKGSVMAPFAFLFEKHKIDRSPSPQALRLPSSIAPGPGWEVVPKPDAEALVGYLLSLKVNTALPEAPLGE
jgi:cytochrome c oxidase cbb3-type subunit II